MHHQELFRRARQSDIVPLIAVCLVWITTAKAADAVHGRSEQRPNEFHDVSGDPA